MIMSYINEALQKAQKENESCYAAYGHVIGTSTEKTRRPARRVLLASVLILSILVAITIALLYGRMDKKEVSAKPGSLPAAAPAANELPPARANSAVLPPPPETLPGNTAKEDAGVPQRAKEESPVPRIKEKQVIIDSPAMFAQALRKQNEGNLLEARDLYRKIIKNDPHNVQALNNLGVIYMSKKNYKRAAARFNAALAIKPDYADVHYNLACLYSRTKDVARSIHYLQTAIRLNPDVRQWAKNDSDLQELSRFPDFHNLLEEPEN
jgi:tetratricopeptide (TPR) repeat protein